MNYVYPKLSEHDLGFIRIGGAGLGNILFPYARAAVYARDHECQMIWPTWPSVKVGPWLRRERDKRFYGNLFTNRLGYIDGWHKIKLLAHNPRIKEQDRGILPSQDETILEFTGFEHCFEEIMYDYVWVRENLEFILSDFSRRSLNQDFNYCIGVHVRLGDFSRVDADTARSGRHDSALPIEWYVSVISQIRDCAGRNLTALIFSDGTDDELKPVLSLPNTQRITFGNSISDIFGLSQTSLLVASGSSFSMWARYLGRHDCICYTNQKKQAILTPEEDAIECETDGSISDEMRARIRKIFD